MCMTEYKSLHAEEKKKLQTTGHYMYTDFNTLMRCVDNVNPKFECVKSLKEAQTQMLVIYNELNRNVYKYDDHRYQQCKNKLNEGIEKMNREKRNFERVEQYNRLVECTGRCVYSENSYANAWDKILKFNVTNKHPNTMRMGGYHAFKKSSMGGMLHELKMLSSSE